ncbi:MAG: DUF4276 family protein [Nocardioides sp.]
MTLTHLEVLVEEPSMERAARSLLPKIAPGPTVRVRAFNGKPDLLSRLPGLMRGYRHWPDASGMGVVVIVDQDSDDCRALLHTMTEATSESGLAAVSVSANTPGRVLNRLAVEELEAWWLGDPAAVRSAYPGVKGTEQAFRRPDDVRGGTWEAFERVLQKAGHHRGGLRKIAAAQDIAPLMDIEANTSPSFVKFRDGVRLLVNGVPNAASR